MTKNYTSSALVAAMREQHGMSKADAEAAINRVFGSLHSTVNDKIDVRVAGFGTFKKKFVPGRTARNPRTGEPILTADKDKIIFKQGKPA